MRVIGLTGGIASGKSTVSAWLRQWGAHIVDADAISRETTKQGGRGYRAVVARFGREILRPDGELDRRKLGGIVFADEGKRRELEGILHPIVIEESKNEMARAAAQGCTCPRDFPVCVCGKKPRVKLISRKPILPGADEVKENARARSAKLRVCEKL